MVRGRSDPLYVSLADKLWALAPEAAPRISDAYVHLRRELGEISAIEDHQRRGYLLQDFLRRLFATAQIETTRPFTRNEGGEQIDGALALDGWHYLVECRWRQQPANIRELDGLYGQVARSARQTMGLFISMGGWSENVPGLLKQNPEKAIVLASGDDIRGVVDGRINLASFIREKLMKLNRDGEPYYSLAEYLAGQAA